MIIFHLVFTTMSYHRFRRKFAGGSSPFILQLASRSYGGNVRSHPKDAAEGEMLAKGKQD
jgi:hypothetical protein